MSAFPGFKSLTANFTTVPNQYFDRIVGHYHPCVERVVAILIRSTLGWEDPDTGERRLEAELPLSAFVRPELSQSSARRGLAGAIEAGFLVCTMEATTREPARYALRWADAEAQKSAIVRQRKAHGQTRRRGGKVAEPAWKRRQEAKAQQNQGFHGDTSHCETSHRDTSLYRESEKKSSSEKKRSFKKGLPSASEPDVLSGLGAEQFATLEAEARARVIAENGPPLSELARKGKAMTSVKQMMRQMLVQKVG